MFKFLDRKTKDNLEYEFLPPALEIEETPPSPVKRVLIWVIFAIVVIFFAWSCLGKVEIVAEARGKVLPDESEVVQPMEEGVVRHPGGNKAAVKGRTSPDRSGSDDKQADGESNLISLRTVSRPQRSRRSSMGETRGRVDETCEKAQGKYPPF
jgi:hypothetical protein